MLCDKCHTAMDATDTICKSCGHAVQKLNRNWSRFAKISIITLIIAAFGAYIALYNLGMINLNSITDFFGSASVVEEMPVADVGHVVQVPEGEVNVGGEIVPLRRDEEEQIATLSTILETVDAYIWDFSAFNPIISNMGYLYNAASNEFVTMELLANHGLDYEYLAEDVFILYLRPMDLALFDEISFDGVSAAQMGFLTVFLGYELPAGIGLFSRFGTQMIFRENLNHLLINNYGSNNGEIFRPTMQDDIYHATVGMISGANPDEDVFIRYLAVDDVHGFVAFSLSGDKQVITNYIFVLEHENDTLVGVRVLATGFEATQHPKVAVNGAVPNFNFGLMPNYDIANVSLLSGDSPVFQDIIYAMEENGLIEEGDLPAFISATAGFAYAVSVLGDGFFIQRSGDSWNFMSVDGWREWEQLMVEHVNSPPLYIMWQQ
ncbi:MAG: hypothetical protein FWC76_02100 [Defluviitaleaceae bacterium]|nr:hypothetical protein [Defluviitaleaceae bacterium]